MAPSNWPPLAHLPLTLKALFTGYLLVIGIGLLVAGAQIMLTHGMADGKPGLSVDDIVYSYYGDRTGSRLESKLKGSMQDKAPPNKNAEMIKWVREGADRADWETHIQPITAQYCVSCHASIDGLPNVGNFEEIKPLTEIDTGPTWSSLTRVSHIHLFGIAFIFFMVGLIFSFARGFHPWVQAGLIFTPFAFLIIDISAWWLTKFHPNFAWMVLIGGFGYALASTVMIFSSLFQMWRLPWFERRSAA